MTYDEALALATENNEGENPIFVIDKNLRTVTMPSDFVLGVYNDKDVQVIPFLMPRYYNDIDLSEFAIRVNFVNSNGDGDMYLVYDEVVDEDTITFNWVVGRTAFLYKGDVSFVVCFIEIDSLGIVTREYNTTITTAKVLEGLEVVNPVSDQVVADILAQIQAYAERAGTAAGNAETSAEHASGSEINAAESESNAEAWAVGRRGGSDVESSDATYHNNAYYYATQAANSAQASATSAASITSEFSTAESYTAGEYVFYNGQLYKFTANHSAGAWTGSDAEEADITDLSTLLNEDYAEAKDLLDALFSDIAHTESGSTASQNYAVGDYVIANGQLYAVTSAIPNGGTITVGTNVRAISVDAVLKDLEERKADNNGTYKDMTVGNAEQIVATTYTEDKIPYNFRTSGGSADIGDREQDTLIGGTVAWNQLIDFSETLTFATSSTSDQNVTPPYVHFTKNHIYLLSCTQMQTLTSNTRNTLKYNDGSTHYQYSTTNAHLSAGRHEWLVKAETTYADVSIGFWCHSPNTQASYKDFQCIDFTQMFGTTIADYIYSLETSTPGAGVAWFKRLFPKPYYAYNAGELMSVNAISHDMVGFNQWDGSYTAGSIISANTGNTASVGTNLGCTGYIPVIAGSAYYLKIKGLGSSSNGMAWYDADKNFISGVGFSGSPSVDVGVVTAPANAAYMRCSIYTADAGTTCINLSHNGTRNGEYLPYEKRTYALADLTLRGIPKLDAANQLYYDGDVYEADGTVTRRFRSVTYNGSENWAMESAGWNTGGLNSFYVNLGSGNTGKQPGYNYVVANGVANILRTGSYNDLKNSTAPLTWSLTGQGAYVEVLSNDADVAAWKSYLSAHPVTIVYELATPTTDSATPYAVNQAVDDWGTEEYVDGDYSDGTRDVAIPVGHETKYPANLRDKLQHLPNLATTDGTYVISQSGSSTVLTPLITPTELPTAPSTDGTYRLIATVSGGNVTYSWANN